MYWFLSLPFRFLFARSEQVCVRAVSNLESLMPVAHNFFQMSACKPAWLLLVLHACCPRPAFVVTYELHVSSLQTFVEGLVRLPGCFLCYTPADFDQLLLSHISYTFPFCRRLWRSSCACLAASCATRLFPRSALSHISYTFPFCRRLWRSSCACLAASCATRLRTLTSPPSPPCLPSPTVLSPLVPSTTLPKSRLR